MTTQVDPTGQSSQSQRAEQSNSGYAANLRDLVKAQVRVISADDNAQFFPDTYVDRLMGLFQRDKQQTLDKLTGYNLDHGNITLFVGEKIVAKGQFIEEGTS